MNIPSRVNPFGYDNSLPPGYFRVDFLENGSGAYIDTEVLNVYSYELDYEKVGGQFTEYVIGYQVKGTNLIYGCPSDNNVSITEMTGGKYARRSSVSAYDRHTLKHAQNMGATCYIDGLAYSTSAYGAHSAGVDATEEDISLYLFGAHNTAGIYRSNMQARIYSCTAWDVDENLLGNFRPVINAAGVPCIFDSVTGNAYINSGSGKFIAGCAMEQAESLGSVIPTNTKLTVSFPWEAKLVQHNSRVEYSLEQASNKGCTISVQYREPEQDSVIYNKYAECETVADMVAVNPEYKTDLTIEGAWEYPLPKLRDADMAFKDSPIRKFSVTLPALVNGKQFFCGTALEGEMIIDLPSISRVGSSQMFVTSASNERKLTKLTINAKPGSAVHQIVNSWTVSDYYLEELNLTGFTDPWYSCDALAIRHYALKRFRTDAVGCVVHWNNAFAQSILDKESVLSIVKATLIPVDPAAANVTSHIGIHVDYKTDEEVLAAISTLEAGGHKLSIRWNGTPTSGVSLMDLEEIWCKVVEKEDGEYVNENGIRCDIDWGHYVTDTAAYKLFFSLAEAEEYYKLVKVV